MGVKRKMMLTMEQERQICLGCTLPRCYGIHHAECGLYKAIVAEGKTPLSPSHQRANERRAAKEARA